MCVVLPWLLFYVVPMLVVFLFVTRFYVRSSRQLKRLAGVTRSPVYHRFGELTKGLSSIRVFGADTRLRKAFESHVDRNIMAELLFETSSRWLGIRLDALNAFTVALLTGLSVYLAEFLDPGLLAVALVQSLQLAGILQYSIRQAAEVENLMTSVERVSAYSRLRVEQGSGSGAGAGAGRGAAGAASSGAGGASGNANGDRGGGTGAYQSPMQRIGIGRTGNSPPNGTRTKNAQVVDSEGSDGRGSDSGGGSSSSPSAGTTMVAVAVHDDVNVNVDVDAGVDVSVDANPSKQGGGVQNNGRWPLAGEVKVEGLRLRYRSTLPLALRGVDFTLGAGKIMGVVGRTGSGKSTLLTAFFRLVEAEAGSIRVDGADVRTMDLFTVRRGLTIIPQDPTLFEGTVRSNLDPFSEYNDEQIWEALRTCHLDKTIVARHGEDGNDGGGDGGGGGNGAAGGASEQLRTRVTGGGLNFSVGQRQLMCVARALIRRPKLLLLDEATASIDPETDRLIQHTIRSCFQGCTMLIIAHRLETIIDADRILVLDGGEVMECGTPARLLARPDSAFGALVDAAGPEAAGKMRASAAAAEGGSRE